jgi:hypothetical protein
MCDTTLILTEHQLSNQYAMPSMHIRSFCAALHNSSANISNSITYKYFIELKVQLLTFLSATISPTTSSFRSSTLLMLHCRSLVSLISILSRSWPNRSIWLSVIPIDQHGKCLNGNTYKGTYSMSVTVSDINKVQSKQSCVTLLLTLYSCIGYTLRIIT